jgi:hypothetical protein
MVRGARFVRPRIISSLIAARGARALSDLGGHSASLFLLFPFHSVYSIEDHKKRVDRILAMNPDVALIG